MYVVFEKTSVGTTRVIKVGCSSAWRRRVYCANRKWKTQVTCCGRAFHTRGPATGKAQSATVERRVHGQSETSTRQSEDAVRPRSRPTDAVSQLCTAVLCRADICTRGQRAWTWSTPGLLASEVGAVAEWRGRTLTQRTPAWRPTSSLRPLE